MASSDDDIHDLEQQDGIFPAAFFNLLHMNQKTLEITVYILDIL
jgi:hypothetical protein